MYRLAILFGLICFTLAGVGSYFLATKAVETLETYTENLVTDALVDAGHEWSTVRADGINVYLSGLAPDEGSRFEALETLGATVQINRVVDKIIIAKTKTFEPPEFSLEMLRNDDRISLIGLIPQSTGRAQILKFANQLSESTQVADMLETADHPVSDLWRTSLQFGLESLDKMPRSKISVTEGKVIITAVTESLGEKKSSERFLRSSKPDGVQLIMQISSPRPVISPFSFRMSIDTGRTALIACSADTELTKRKILLAAKEAGLEGAPNCAIGLGVPTTEWAKAIKQGISALTELGGGSLTFTDSDVSLVATDLVSQATFDTVVGKLENALPDLFSLHAVLPPKIISDGTEGGLAAPEFIATKSPEGIVQLRGRVPSQSTKEATDTYARSLFGNEKVFLQTRVDDNLPGGWPLRILAGLEALSKMHHGSAVVREDIVEIKGTGAKPTIPAEVTRALATRLGGKGNYSIDVEFDENLFEIDEVPTPQECARGISALLVRDKIEFAPSSARIDESSLTTITKIADILRKCPDAKFEIEGHTDNQGSEELNQDISQRRAESVLSALISQRILTSGISAKGYGLSQPIADNNTEEGRAANRRIAFSLMTETSADSSEEGQ